MGQFDKLSGFFTPVWESARKGGAVAPSSDGAARGSKADPSEPLSASHDAVISAAVEETGAAEPRSADHVLESSLPVPSAGIESTAAPDIGSTHVEPAASTETAQAALLRRMRRTMHLYSPLPEEIRTIVARSRRG